MAIVTVSVLGAVLVMVLGMVALVALSVSAEDSSAHAADDVQGEMVSSYELAVGDCIADIPDEGTVEGMDVVPCDEPHVGEVVSVDDDLFADAQRKPTDEQMWQETEAACTVAMEEYTGVSLEDSDYDVYYLYPSPESWRMEDDRGVVCIGLTPDESTGSIEATSGAATVDEQLAELPA